MSPDTDELLRFLDKRKTGPGCWEWQADKTQKGYGRILCDGKVRFAHRLAWFFATDDWPEGRVIRHKCDNPSCVRPDHLQVGTVADNNWDRSVRGRHTSSVGVKNGMAKLTLENVRYIRMHPEIPQNKLAAQFGVSKTAIRFVQQGKTWR